MNLNKHLPVDQNNSIACPRHARCMPFFWSLKCAYLQHYVLKNKSYRWFLRYFRVIQSLHKYSVIETSYMGQNRQKIAFLNMRIEIARDASITLRGKCYSCVLSLCRGFLIKSRDKKEIRRKKNYFLKSGIALLS